MILDPIQATRLLTKAVHAQSDICACLRHQVRRASLERGRCAIRLCVLFGPSLALPTSCLSLRKQADTRTFPPRDAAPEGGESVDSFPEPSSSPERLFHTSLLPCLCPVSWKFGTSRRWARFVMLSAHPSFWRARVRRKQARRLQVFDSASPYGHVMAAPRCVRQSVSRVH